MAPQELRSEAHETGFSGTKVRAEGERDAQKEPEGTSEPWKVRKSSTRADYLQLPSFQQLTSTTISHLRTIARMESVGLMDGLRKSIQSPSSFELLRFMPQKLSGRRFRGVVWSFRFQIGRA